MMTESDWGDISLGKRSFIKTDIAEPPPEFYKVSESPTYRQMINQFFIKFHTARKSTYGMCVRATGGL